MQHGLISSRAYGHWLGSTACLQTRGRNRKGQNPCIRYVVAQFNGQSSPAPVLNNPYLHPFLQSRAHEPADIEGRVIDVGPAFKSAIKVEKLQTGAYD